MRCWSSSLTVLFLTAFTACNADGGAGGSCTSSAQCRTGQSCVAGVCRTNSDAGMDARGDAAFDATPGPEASVDVPARATVTSVTIDPPNAMLTSVDGGRVTQSFSARFERSDGTQAPALGGVWTLSSPALGEIDASTGVFTANGLAGGSVRVQLEVANPSGGAVLRATAMLEVSVSRTITAMGAPAADEAARLFTTVMPASMAGTQSANVLYPLNGVVFPQNVFPADVQWQNGAMGDVFRITLTKPHATITAYVQHTGSGFGNHWLVDETAWRTFAQTDGDAAATLTVDRSTGGMAYASEPIALRFAKAAVTGSVYYWDIERGRIVRIDDGTATRNEIMPTPPIDSTGRDRCVGCHSVAPNGRWMGGRLGGGENIGGVFDLTTDLTAANPPTVFPLRRDPTMANTSARWWFSSWAPDSRRMAVTFDEGTTRRMRILDGLSGEFLPTMGAELPTNATHPAWAPDNSAIAFVGNVDQWGGGNTRGDVGIVPLAMDGTVGTARFLHQGASLAMQPERGSADAYPTWEPDSRRIAFAHGTGSRSDTSDPTMLRQSALYAMDADGSNVVRLAAASGDGNDSFQPRFAPFESAGYFWLSFLSRRDYGNTERGTRGSRRQQIWVAAIRSPAMGVPAGMDPSSPPYWLPGQNTSSRNIAAFWAPRPCRSMGEGCSVGSECCSGDCRPPSGGGASVCSPPSMTQCRRANQTCDTTADCCMGMGLTCSNHVCAMDPG